jgi:lysine 6-dehydrogenase
MNIRYQYVIFGAGRQGRAIAYYLARSKTAMVIYLVDQISEKCIATTFWLKQLFPFDTYGVLFTAYPVQFLTDASQIIIHADVVISALPHKYNNETVAMATEAGAHYCDLGFDPKIVARQLKDYEEIARKRNVTVVPNCGVGPPY